MGQCSLVNAHTSPRKHQRSHVTTAQSSPRPCRLFTAGIWPDSSTIEGSLVSLLYGLATGDAIDCPSVGERAALLLLRILKKKKAALSPALSLDHAPLLARLRRVLFAPLRAPPTVAQRYGAACTQAAIAAPRHPNARRSP